MILNEKNRKIYITDAFIDVEYLNKKKSEGVTLEGSSVFGGKYKRVIWGGSNVLLIININ